jgi:hypothetical protein
MGQDDAVSLYPTITGQGVTVAILDTGVDYNNPLLGGGFGAGKKVKAGFDFVDNDADPMDTFGHGTANAGLLAASPYDNGGVHAAGIAPGVEIVALRVSSGGDVVTYQRIEQALQWIITNAATYNISIVNFSFGTGRFTEIENNPTVSDEFKTIADMGILFTAPSGNQGGVGVMYPGADASVVAVGSVNTSDAISSFTQRGKLMDILAPGENLRTLALSNGFTTVSDGSYPPPLIAGAAALLKQVDPKLKANDMMSILTASGVVKEDGGLKYSRLDIDNAILLAQRRFATNAALGDNDLTHDLAYDKFGVLHLTYYDNAAHTLRYATRNTSGEWSAISSIDTTGLDIGATHSLAIDSLGRPAVAYYDATNGDLGFARFDGRTWKKSTLDSKNIGGQFPSLAFDANDGGVIAYYRKTSGDLRVMHFVNNAWTRWDPDTGGTTGNVGTWTSLDVSPSGQFGVAYSDVTNGDLKYAQYNGSTWSVETVDNLNTVAFISVAFDNSNVPAIAYYDAFAADLKYAVKPSTWSTTTVASKGAVGLDTSLWFDDQNKANIVYFNRKSNGIFRLIGGPGSWAAETLSLVGGVHASAAPTVDGVKGSYAFFDTLTNKIVSGDLT